jgi:hypothetical protein
MYQVSFNLKSHYLVTAFSLKNAEDSICEPESPEWIKFELIPLLYPILL